MGALSKNGKYFIIRNLQNVINNTLTVINMASSEALTASVILTDAVYSRKWILTIASTISDVGVFSIAIDHNDHIKSVNPQVVFDENGNIKISFKIEQDDYTSEIEMNKDYSIKDVTYSTFMKQFMNEGRVIAENTPILTITYPKETWGEYSDSTISTAKKPNSNDCISTVTANNGYKCVDCENTAEENNNSPEI